MSDTWWVSPDELDEHQRRVIGLSPEGSYFVSGPPGSGKTNLLMLKAKEHLRAGRANILFLVFTRTLEEFIASCPAAYRVPADNLKTCQRWQMQLINEYNGKPSTAKEFIDQRRENSAILRKLLHRQGMGKIYDAILLDEAQDYWPDEIKLFASLTDRLFAVGDGRQAIYPHESPIPSLEGICQRLDLPYHYRNGQEICKLADEIGKSWNGYLPLLRDCQYNESAMPSRVLVHQCRDIQAQAKEIEKHLELQLKAYPNELIGVLCPRNAEVSAVYDYLKTTSLAPKIVHQGSDDGFLPFSKTVRICVCTIHSAKGLEFRVAHIAGCDYKCVKGFRELQKKLMYTGVTRAKTRLHLYHSEKMSNPMHSAILASSGSGEKSTIDDLFKD